MLTNSTSKYFEILAHPIRFAILKFIDINTRSFSEILAEMNSEIEIKGNKLNFHLKKMVDEGILVKEDKIYFVSELGLKLLSLVYQFESHETMVISDKDEENEDEIANESTLTKETIEQKEKLPLIKKIPNVPVLISMFEYFEGKNYDFMELNYSLPLPTPISTNIDPIQWIQEFSKELIPLLLDEKAKEWLIDRYLKLGYGTRGLQDYGLMDASVSVPPLESLINTSIELLTSRGKTGLYARTGMGKSRIELYVASYWMRTFKTAVFYIQNPHYLSERDFEQFQSILSSQVGSERTTPKYLIIIEDAHLLDDNQLRNVKKIISGATNKTYSVFVSFSKIEILKDTIRSEDTNLSNIEQLKSELIPNEYAEALDLQKHWANVKPYFNEWIKWVAADILFDLLPNFDSKSKKLENFQSPWSFVVSLGFLKVVLHNLQKSSLSNSFPLLLYHFLAQIYIMREEQGISLPSLIAILKSNLQTELEKVFEADWKPKIISLLNSWTDPSTRLLPPFKFIQNSDVVNKEPFISFYHIEWAKDVCRYLEEPSTESNVDYEKFYNLIFPILKYIWSNLHTNKVVTGTFLQWLRASVRFDIVEGGQVLLTTLLLKPSQKNVLQEFKVPESWSMTLNKSQLVNWMFIKSVIKS